MTDRLSSDARRDAAYFSSLTEEDPGQQFDRERESAFLSMPPVNMVIAGKTGVGKSTLINNMLRKPLAETGVGRPVTDRVMEYSDPDLRFKLYDTPGIELGKESRQVTQDYLQLIRSKRSSNVEEHIHLTCYCIHAEHRRIEDYEIQLIKDLATEIDVVLVLTQCLNEGDTATNEFADAIQKLELPIAGGKPIKTLSEKREIGPHRFEPFGLEELVLSINGLLPEAVRRAFSNAQGVAIQLKIDEARKAVLPWATSAAAAIGAVPIPIPDAGPLLALQLAMLARITVVMGVEIEADTKRTLIQGFLRLGGMRSIGRAAASWLLKFVPGAGSVINATVAATLTATLGEAYIQFCGELLRRQATGRPIPKSEMLNVLMNQYERSKR